MPIAHNNSTLDAAAVSSTTKTFAHTTSGTNRILFVGTGVDGTVDLVTGVTYAGVAMTKINFRSAPDRVISLWYLLAPATGSNNVVITASSSTFITGGATSYTGADQSAPEAQNVNSATATSLTTSVTTLTNNSWVTGFCFADTSTTAAGASTFERSDGGGFGFYDSNAPVTPAGSRSLIVTVGTSTAIRFCMAAFKEAPATNSQLSILTISSGVLFPTFVKTHLNYSVTLLNSVSSVTVNPTVDDVTSTVKVNNVTVSSGSNSQSIALSVGTNSITIIVTATDASTTTYVINVYREMDKPSIKGLVSIKNAQQIKVL